MKVRDVMTADPVRIPTETTVDEAVRTMEEHGIRHLPVLEDGRLVGVVSDRDLLEATGWLPARVRDVFDPESRGRRVGEIVRRPAVTVGPDVSVVSACLDLVGRAIGCLPVVEGRELVGLVSETDLLTLYLQRCRGGPSDAPISERMTSPVATVSGNATLEKAAERMVSLGVRHLPVVEREILLGMLSDRDVHRAAGAGRPGEARVNEVMVREVVTLGPNAPLSHAAERMLADRIGAVPVVEDGALEGLITVTDVLEHCVGALCDPSRLGAGEGGDA